LLTEKLKGGRCIKWISENKEVIVESILNVKHISHLNEIHSEIV
jgi:hypothetical protein